MMFLFFLFFIICPSGNNKEILNYLNSLKTEEEIFISIKKCPSNFLVKEGIARLKEQKYLEKIAKERDWYLKYIVIEKLKNESILKEIYLKEDDQLIKDEAIKYIKDQNFLKYAILNDKNINALKNLKDEIFLKELALKNENEEIKEKSLYFIENPSILKEIIKISENNNIIELAFLKIKNNPILKEIFFDNFSYEKKIKALDYMEDDFLKSLLEIDDFLYKKEALQKIKDEIFLIEHFNKTEDLTLKISALKNIKNESFLKKVFKEENELRQYAILNIQDEEFLKESSIYLKLNGIERISNENVLKEIFEKENYWFIRYKALKKIKDKKFLENVKDKSFLEDINKVKEIEGKIPREEICEDLSEKYFKDIKTIKKIINDLGNDFSVLLKPFCKEKRYFFEEENSYPPERGRVFQVKLKIEIINRSSNFYKKIEYFGRNLSKREKFDKSKGKINNYYVKYYVPGIDFLDFTIEILKEFKKEEILKYLKSENKYIKASALISKSEME